MEPDKEELRFWLCLAGDFRQVAYFLEARVVMAVAMFVRQGCRKREAVISTVPVPRWAPENDWLWTPDHVTLELWLFSLQLFL